jgi:hypothetical protein
VHRIGRTDVSARSPFVRRCRCPIGWAVATLLVVVPVAAAEPSAPDVSSSPGSPTNAGAATFSWSASAPDPGFEIVRYEGGLRGEGNDDFGLARSVRVDLPGQGSHVFRVRAVQRPEIPPGGPEVAGPYGRATIVVDRSPPAISVRLSPSSPNGTNGWYRNAEDEGGSRLVVNWSCSDEFGIAYCPGDEAVATLGAGQRRSGFARDAAGNQSETISSPVFNYDGARPNTGPMRAPSPGAIVAAEPTFVWGPAIGSETSGFNRYEIMVRIGGTYRVAARVAHAGGASQYSATRNPGILSQPFPRDTELRWFVRTYDNAGNAGGGTSQSRAFRIDSTVPGPPAITGGPSGPTNVSGPTFTWAGSQPSFAWEVSVSGTESVVRSGAGPQKQASLAPLPDGDYTFAVSQVTAAGARGAEATRSFVVDTVAPPAPVITGRPPFPTNDATPSFAWTTEAGAFSRWRVIASNGRALQRSDTPLSGVTLNPLGSGAYTFRVAQVDVAGNESAGALDPFSIVGVASPTSRRNLLRLPTQNAKRLRPRAGITLKTRRPVLRWTRGPAGTTVYNLQVFRVLRARTASTTPAVKKIYSVFPRARRYRMPTAKIRPGTCYVWRIWPFVGNRFTGSPLGVSNFCIASARVLRQSAGTAPARRRARSR